MFSIFWPKIIFFDFFLIFDQNQLLPFFEQNWTFRLLVIFDRKSTFSTFFSKNELFWFFRIFCQKLIFPILWAEPAFFVVLHQKWTFQLFEQNERCRLFCHFWLRIFFFDFLEQKRIFLIFSSFLIKNQLLTEPNSILRRRRNHLRWQYMELVIPGDHGARPLSPRMGFIWS